MIKILLFGIVFSILLVMMAPEIAFADHNNPKNEKKSAYLFSFAGNGPSQIQDSWFENFLASNNGVNHESAYNYLNIEPTSIDRKECDKKTKSGNWDICNKHNYLRNENSGADKVVRTWWRIQTQYAQTFDSYPLLDAKERNAKILLFGYSFGGYSATLIADDDRNLNVNFDLVWLIDPVGHAGTRYPIDHIPYSGKIREFSSNVKKIVVVYQKQSAWPSDIASDIKFQSKGPIETTVYECPENKKSDCHSYIKEQLVGQDRVKELLQKWMNQKPLLSSPDTLFLYPGESFKVTAFDPLTRWDSNPKLKFRLGPGTNQETEPISVSESTSFKWIPSWTPGLLSSDMELKLIPGNYGVTWSDNEGYIKVIGIREDNSIYQTSCTSYSGLHYGPGCQGWVDLKDGDASGFREFFVTESSPNSGIFELWVLDNENKVHHAITYGSWETISKEGFAKEVVAVNVGSGLIRKNHVFVIDSDDKVQFRSRAFSSAVWEPLWSPLSERGFAKEIFVTAPRESPSTPEQFNVWVIDIDGAVHHKLCKPTCSGSESWNSLSERGFAKEIFVTNIHEDSYNVWVIGTDDEVYFKSTEQGPGPYYEPTWSDWESLGGNVKQIAVATTGTGNYHHLYAIDKDDSVQHKYWDGSTWSGWWALSEPGFAKQISVTGYNLWVIDSQNTIQRALMEHKKGLESTAEFKPLYKGTYVLELIVEDNGWPCDYCTDGGAGQDAARGALGKYDIKPITLIVKGGSDDDPENPLSLNIPSWVKFIAEMWSKGLIGDAEFAEAMRFLVNTNVIVIPDLPESGQTGRADIPEWIKFNAEQWSKNLLSDSEFVNGIKWIIENGIINMN